MWRSGPPGGQCGPENGGDDRPAEKADEIRPERQQGGGEGVGLWEEQLAEHETCGGAVEEKIIPFDGGADGGGDDGPTQLSIRDGVRLARIGHAATHSPHDHLLRSCGGDQSIKAREVSILFGFRWREVRAMSRGK